jgi:hypothetical protein
MRPYSLVQVLIVQKAAEHCVLRLGWESCSSKENVRTEGIRLGETRFEGAKARRRAMLWECNHHLRFSGSGQFQLSQVQRSCIPVR